MEHNIRRNILAIQIYIKKQTNTPPQTIIKHLEKVEKDETYLQEENKLNIAKINQRKELI